MRSSLIFVIGLFLLAPSVSHAARLWSAGCELQDVGQMNNKELFVNNGSAWRLQISSAQAHSGSKSCQFIATSTPDAPYVNHYFINNSVATNGTTTIRFYLYIDTSMSVSGCILNIFDQGVDAQEGCIRLNTNNTLSYLDDDSTVLGTTTALTSATWNRVELGYNSGSTYEIKINGSFALQGGTHDGDAVDAILLGICTGAICTASANLYFDDLAINDTSGTVQTDYPGEGSIVLMRPDGTAGDANGASSGSCADVDENEPDGATTIAVLDAAADILDCNVVTPTSAGLDDSDTITLIQVGAYEAAVSAAAESWNTRIKSASGGSTSSGTTVSHDDTTYRTNGDLTFGINGVYPLTSYTDPTTAAAWTVSGTNSLENMQIGLNAVDATPDINLSSMWALIEYVDGVPATGSSSSTPQVIIFE